MSKQQLLMVGGKIVTGSGNQFIDTSNSMKMRRGSYHTNSVKYIENNSRPIVKQKKYPSKVFTNKDAL